MKIDYASFWLGVWCSILGTAIAFWLHRRLFGKDDE